jgi:hypothetical protein
MAEREEIAERLSRDTEIARDPAQHQEKCPGCLGRNTHLVPGHIKGEFFMGCDSCGHTWVGKDFPMNEQGETPLPIPETDPK